MEITALNNNLVKETVKLHQKKYRTETGKFLLEGYKVITEAIKCGIEFDYIFVLADKAEKYNIEKSKLIHTNEAVLKKISTTESFAEAVGVAYQPKQNTETLKSANRVILLENISDAGNLGTIIRSAAAFNIDAIILYGDTVDVYNPKCVRSTVGNLWKTNIFNIKSLAQCEKYFADFERVATLPKSNNTIYLNEWNPSKKTLIMFGSEADGLSEELKNYATKNVTIEMSEAVESLNLSISAGIFMYKLII